MGTMDVLTAIVGVGIILVVMNIVVSELDSNITRSDYTVDAQTSINKTFGNIYTSTQVGSIVPLVMIFGLIMAALGMFGRA